jgi:hypothetical protein
MKLLPRTWMVLRKSLWVFFVLSPMWLPIATVAYLVILAFQAGDR